MLISLRGMLSLVGNKKLLWTLLGPAWNQLDCGPRYISRMGEEAEGMRKHLLQKAEGRT